MNNSINYFSRVRDTISSINHDDVHTLVDLILSTRNNHGIIFTCGNGGSSANASHFSGDLMKGLSFCNTPRFKSICLSDNIPGMLAVSNDMDYSKVFIEPLKNLSSSNDLIIGISGSGNSENVIQAIQYGNEINATTISLTGFDGGKLKKLAKHSVHIPVNDMEIAEDIHMMTLHAVKQLLIDHISDSSP
tara:strand:- start:115 stop:684 length:570 start_codon:yes stop_codon:yes gene_type:complete